MTIDRRHFLAAAAIPLAVSGARAADPPAPAPRPNPIGRSTFSFGQFPHRDRRDIEKCIDLAAAMGFDGVEILHRQMEKDDNGYLQQLKRRAFTNGLDLMGFSIHQGFLSPSKETRQKNVDHTLKCIELAYAMGIPTMRVNTGTWGTSKNFDELMKNRGIEPPPKDVTEEDGFKWLAHGFGQPLNPPQQCPALI